MQIRIKKPMETNTYPLENQIETPKLAKSFEHDLRNNPFPGLRSYRQGEEHLFFGREKQVDELAKKLYTTRFLTVIGEVGCGKSSLIKAGLFPHICKPGSINSTWQIISLSSGTDPILNLSKAIATQFFNHTDAHSIQNILRKSEKGLIEVFQTENVTSRILIFVDQFEEIFSLSQFEKNNHQVYRDSILFVNLLLNVIKQNQIPISIIISLRSDFLGDCTGFRGLPEAINEGQYLVPRMGRDEIQEAITRPLEIKNVKITQRLEKVLLNDLTEAEDQLPLLQHALRCTWDCWYSNRNNGELIDIVHYEAIGKIYNSISKTAEKAYAELISNRNMQICDLLLVALTRKLSGNRMIRNEATILEISELTRSTIEEVIEVIGKFKKPGRDLLIFNVNHNISSESTVSICHEALMVHWVRFKALLEEEKFSVELYLKLVKAAQLYEKGVGELWVDVQLKNALSWKQANKPNSAWGRRYHPDFDKAMEFLKISKENFDNILKMRELNARPQSFKNAKLYIALILLFVVLLLIVVFTLK